MDGLSIVGIVVALSAILGGNVLDGGHTSSLFQLTAFIIVVGGTAGAVMLQTPLPTFLRSLKILPWVIIPPQLQWSETIQKILAWSTISRREGLLQLESVGEEESNPFIKKCIQLLVDGGEPEAIRELMQIDLSNDESRDRMAVKVFESAGGYCPTIGIIGAVMGLIHVMQNLTDPSKLGAGIAVAFVATIYGVGIANLVLLPIANKLKAVITHHSSHKEMILEGIVAIAEGENPRYIENKLNSYLP